MLFDYFKTLIINNIKQSTMTPTNNKITEIFYLTDSFCQEFENSIQKHLIGNKPKRKATMSCS